MLLLFKRLNNPILPLLSYQLSNSSKKQTKIKLKAQTPASSLNARKAFKHDFTECINSIPTTIVFVCVCLLWMRDSSVTEKRQKRYSWVRRDVMLTRSQEILLRETLSYTRQGHFKICKMRSVVFIFTKIYFESPVNNIF